MGKQIQLALLSIAIAIAGPQLWRLPMPFPSPAAVAVPAAKLAADGAAAADSASPALQRAQQLWKGVDHPETPLILEDGTAYIASTVTGELLRSSVQDTSRREHVAWLSAPGGVAMHPDGRIVVCDMVKGLLAVDPSTGAVSLLSSRLSNASLAPAQADLAFCDDVDVGRSGRIYFTDASRIGPMRDREGNVDIMAAALVSFLQGEPTGRLLAYDPATGTTALLADGIWFANGLAVAEDESYVLVAETFGSRLLRHWLAGPLAGTTEVFIEGLPGFPDGVSRSPGGTSFWVAIVAIPNRMQQLLPKLPWLRWLAAWAPPALQPKARAMGLAVEVSADGRVLRSLSDPTGDTCHDLTSAVEVDGTLYMGTLKDSHVCALHLGASIK